MPAISLPKPSDIRLTSVELAFSDERLETPLRLSRGVITDITYVQVTVQVVTRQGKSERGSGSILLSDLWAFPHPTLDHATKDRAMRAVCANLANIIAAGDIYSDPLQKLHWLEERLDQAVTTVEIQEGWSQGTLPRLAALNCLSPFDAAIHDSWGRAIGASVYQLYAPAWLNAPLESYFAGEAAKTLAGHYPCDYLVARRPSLRIQHVVGVGDALIPDAAPNLPQDTVPLDIPTNLTDWIKRDGLCSFKIKSKGQDPLIDAQRIAAVYTTARATQPPHPIRLSLDPNEGCPDAAFLLEMLNALARDTPDAYAALEYIEQPTARDLSSYTFTLHEVAARKPVILDESFDSFDVLPQMVTQGWSGLAVKTCKGQSASVLGYCWAKARNYHVTLQDLTNPGRALVHSANLCVHLGLSFDAFECNSRQYMPHSRPAEQAAYPSYFHAVDGVLYPSESNPIGLY